MNPFNKSIKGMRMKTKSSGKRGPLATKSAKPSTKKIGPKARSIVC